MATNYFKELKDACGVVWEAYKDRPGGYYEEKMERVDRVKKEEDAFILVNMFDRFNQFRLWELLSEWCKEHYRDLFAVDVWSKEGI